MGKVIFPGAEPDAAVAAFATPVAVVKAPELGTPDCKMEGGGPVKPFCGAPVTTFCGGPLFGNPFGGTAPAGSGGNVAPSGRGGSEPLGDT